MYRKSYWPRSEGVKKTIVIKVLNFLQFSWHDEKTQMCARFPGKNCSFDNGCFENRFGLTQPKMIDLTSSMKAWKWRSIYYQSRLASNHGCSYHFTAPSVCQEITIDGRGRNRSLTTPSFVRQYVIVDLHSSADEASFVCFGSRRWWRSHTAFWFDETCVINGTRTRYGQGWACDGCKFLSLSLSLVYIEAQDVDDKVLKKVFAIIITIWSRFKP